MTETNTIPEWSYVLGVDPGTTTGLSLVRLDMSDGGKPEHAWYDQLGWDDACDMVENLIRRLYVEVHGNQALAAAIAPEQFTLTSQSAQRGQQGASDALGMLGVVDRYARKAGMEVGPRETASAAKNLIQDDTLRRLDMWLTGQRHANDATRHALLFAVKRHWLETRWLAVGL